MASMGCVLLTKAMFPMTAIIAFSFFTWHSSILEAAKDLYKLLSLLFNTVHVDSSCYENMHQEK